jgi:ribosomal protein L40E
MKICNSCGRQLSDTVNFCAKCGADVSHLLPVAEPDPSQAGRDSGSKICPRCGAENPATAKFCRQDGAQLPSYFHCVPKERIPGSASSRNKSLALWMTIIVVLLFASMAGGYFLYMKFTDKPKSAATTPLPPANAAHTPKSSAAPRAADLQATLTLAKALSFIKEYYTALRERDIEKLLGYYAEIVDYYGKGRVTGDFIRKDKSLFFRKWTTIENSVVGELKLVPEGNNIYTIQFDTAFMVQNSSKSISGNADNTWRLLKTASGLKIIDEKQNVLSRDRM